MSSVIAVALPVFAVIAAGFAAGRFSLLPAGDIAALNRFVFRFAMPAALFGLTAHADPLALSDMSLAGAYAIAAVTGLFGAYFLSRQLFSLDGPSAGAHALTSILGNAVFLGLPIALAIPGWAENFVILMLVEGIGVIALSAALMNPQGGSLFSYFVAPFKNPLVIGMTLGLIVSALTNATGSTLPQPVSSFFDILGRAAGPTALFSLGLFLATTPAPPLNEVGGRIAAIFAVKMVYLPVVMLGLLALFGVKDPLVLGPAALFGLVPSGIGSFVMTSQYGFYTREAAAAIAVTTAISVLTVSAVLIGFAG